MLGAIVLAGETPGKIDPLAAATGVAKKSLIPIAGRPMVSYAYDALDALERVQCVVTVGLTEADGVAFSDKAIYHPGFGDILENALGSIQLIRERHPEITHTLLASADVPLLTSDMVNAFADACLTTQHELYYSVVEQSVMERTYPESGRSFRRFRGQAYAGGDLHMVATGINVGNIERVRQATQSRKSGLGQARLLGIGTLVKFALGRLTVDETVQAMERAFGIQGRAVVSPDAALAMDVDKPHQLDQVRAILGSADLVKALSTFSRRLLDLDQAVSQCLTIPPARPALRGLAALGAHLGDGWLWLLGSLIALAVGTPTTRRLVIWLAVAVLLSVGVGSGIKYLLRRAAADVKGFYSRKLDNYSFPSGHAIRVACIATVLGITNLMWSPLLCLYAGVVALCRVSLGIHYVSDVLAGLLIGALGGALVFGVIL